MEGYVEVVKWMGIWCSRGVCGGREVERYVEMVQLRVVLWCRKVDGCVEEVQLEGCVKDWRCVSKLDSVRHIILHQYYN